MNKKLVSLLLLSSFILTGCSTNTRATQVKISSNTEETSVYVTETFKYNLGGKRAEDIVNEIEYYFNNLPKDGQSLEDFNSMLRVEPVETNNFVIYYYDRNLYKNSPTIRNGYEMFNFTDYSPKNSCILGINYTNLELGMNGQTIDISNNDNVRIELELSILDYKTAEAVYDILYTKYITDNEHGMDDRSGTTWHSCLDYFDENGNSYYINLSLTKQNNCYSMNIEYIPSSSYSPIPSIIYTDDSDPTVVISNDPYWTTEASATSG